MEITEISLTFVDSRGVVRVLRLAPSLPNALATEQGLELSADLEKRDGQTIARCIVRNRSSASLRLRNASFGASTGLPSGSRARFFKHGYQSWSRSGPMEIGVRVHRRDGAPALIRLMHQSQRTRSEEWPEAQLSELFTVLEADGDPSVRMAGFIGGARQLTTVTVVSAAQIVGRALMDDVELAPRAEQEIEPFLVAHREGSPIELAEQWAKALGSEMKARVGSPFQKGWCSWYQYFHQVTENDVRANLTALTAMRDLFPVDLIQIDDGFQSALGDWDTTNDRFPSGLKPLAEEIRAAGFLAGVWTAPFLAARDSLVMKDHPEWLMRDDQGRPLRAGFNTNWTKADDAFAYALDPSHPGFRDHLERLFRKLVAEFGYSYLKLDFLYAGAAEGIRYDRSLTRAATLRRGLEAIRAGAGDYAFILGCGCPLGAAVGIVDGMRIGPDVGTFWKPANKTFGDPSTAEALHAVISRSFMHRRLWLNDPDCLMLRDVETQLSAEERNALALTIAASGGMFLMSDNLALLAKEQAAIFRTCAEIGELVDSWRRQNSEAAFDLLDEGSVRILRWRSGTRRLALALNLGDESTLISRTEFGHGFENAKLIELSTGAKQAAPRELALPPHSARVLWAETST
jgi:alpha-galactosidase